MMAAEPKKPGRVAYLYSRVSSKKQVEGRGLDMQQSNGLRICEKHGWQIDKSVKLVDEGRSRFSGNLDTMALGRFLEMIKEGRVVRGSVLVMDQLDRLSREDADAAFTLFLEITKAGVAIATVDPEFVYEKLNFANGFLVLVEFMRAHSESQQKRRRLSESWDKKRKEARAGKKLLMPNCPGWLEQGEKGGFSVVEKYAATVRRMFEFARKGNGCTLIASTLNEEKAPFWGRSKMGITQRLVYRILTGREVLGEWQPTVRPDGREGRRERSGDPLPGFYPAIIEDAEWLAVQGSISRRKHQRGPAVRNRNLYSGLLKDPLNACSFFCSSINAVPILKSMIYQKRPGMKRGTVPSVHLSRIETILGKMISVMPHAAEDQSAGERLAKLSAELAGADERMRVLQAQFAGGSDQTPQYLLDLMSRLDGTRNELRAEIQSERLRQQNRPGETAGQLSSLLLIRDRTKPEDIPAFNRRCRSLVHEIIERVYIGVHSTGQVVKRWPEKIVLVQINYRNGRVQYGYSGPQTTVSEEMRWRDAVITWDRPADNIPGEAQKGSAVGAALGGTQHASSHAEEASIHAPKLEPMPADPVKREHAEFTYTAFRWKEPTAFPELEKGVTAKELEAMLRKLNLDMSGGQLEFSDFDPERKAKSEYDQWLQGSGRGKPGWKPRKPKNPLKTDKSS